MKVSDVMSNKYLAASDLGGYEGGKEFTLTIASVEKQDFDKGPKFIIMFQNAKKGLVANKTNTVRIAKLYGDETDGWIGKEITLYVDMADFQGRPVEAIRVRPPVRRETAHMAKPPVRQQVPQDFPPDLDESVPF